MVSSQPRALGLWIDRVVAILVVLNLAGTTWVLGGVMTGAMAISFAVMMLTLALVVLRWTVIEPTGCPRGWWWPLPLLGYVAWHVKGVAIAPGRAWLDGLHWGWMAASFAVGLHVMRGRSSRAIVWGGVAAITVGLVGLALYQRLGDPTWLPAGRNQVETFWTRSGGAFGVPNSLAAWMILVLPVAGTVAAGFGGLNRTWRMIGGLVAGGAAIALLITYSRGGGIALGGALICWPLLAAGPGKRGRWRQVGLVALAVVALGGAVYGLVPAAKERLDQMVEQSGELTRPILWRAAGQLFIDAPWLGTGGGSYAVLFERYRPFRFWDEPEWVHNDYLNTLSDYGLIGFSLSFGAVLIAAGVTVRVARRRDRGPRDAANLTAALAVGLLAIGAATGVDFHFKIPAVACLTALVAADWFNSTWRSHRAPPRRWAAAVGLLVAIGVVAFGALAAVPKLRGEGLRFLAREKIDAAAKLTTADELREQVEPTIASLAEAARWFPEHEQVWSDLAYALALQANWAPEEAYEIAVKAEEAARLSLRLCDQSWASWVRLGTALDLQDRWAEAGLAFGQAVKLASNSTEAWYYQAFHLSLKPAGMPVARTALATCLRLDPWNPDGEALRASFERARQ